jgi:hypothetical protein
LTFTRGLTLCVGDIVGSIRVADHEGSANVDEENAVTEGADRYG